ncbi:hypothetical protein B0T21DRAFT_402113 [Apiosordaria backusii]|uniref:Uncharacterized protein n=1 Tax=Apiosordaria backusii TaxID=314023 RepID=A0AA40EH04_9PEZI|nr:hypothetical protein B0T21DRAFT_402113 [Apiosordaria backusii]
MPPVTSDNNLPKLLNTLTKQVKRIKKLVIFSRTFFITLANGRKVVIQFQTEKLDLNAFKVAKDALGQVVPNVMALENEELENKGVWAYSLKRLLGRISLGRILSKGCLTNSSGKAMSTKVRPHLEAILASPLNKVATYRPLLQRFLNKLNEISLGRIHTLASEYTGGEFWIPDEFEVTERAFWKELFAGMSQKTCRMLEKNINGKVGYSKVSRKALPKFLTYRIPQVRGDKPPYKK